MIREDFNRNWKFKKASECTYQEVMLPHDAMLYEGRSKEASGEGAAGYFQGGKYIYEKRFFIPEEWKEDYLAIEFEGVYQKTKVYLNNEFITECSYGYIPFLADISAKKKAGDENFLRVEVDNQAQPNSRWYTGSGIYRPVHLLHGKKEHIKWHGVKIDTVSYDPAVIRVKTEVETEEQFPDVQIEILRDNEIISTVSGNDITVEIPNAVLWSEETPELYQCKVTLQKENKVLDEVTTVFGIRCIECSTKGLYINGKETLLKGACIHHDHGVLGAAVYEESERRRIRKLKEFGYNAIRSSHNPASEAVLRVCDQEGMLVIDESWDMWYGHKNKYDYASEFMDHFESDLKIMVERDYNHPSVIMYSIANEVAEPKDEKGIALAKKMVQLMHEMDSSRPVTAGINLMIISMAAKGKGVYKEEGGRRDQEPAQKSKKVKKQKASGSLFFNMLTSMIGTNMNKMANSKKADAVTSPILDLLDVAGYNYASGRYPLEGKQHPDRVIVGSETFPMDIWKNWQMVEKYPYLLGDFMWTGWDYLGEAGIGAWTYTADGAGFDKPYPWMLADVGTIDILGNPNGEAYYAKTVWEKCKKPYIGVRPVNHPGITPRTATWRGTNCFDSWSWKGCEGNKAQVEVYADAAYAELFLNGKKIAKKKLKQMKALFNTKYQAGVLEAIVYDQQGNEVGRNVLKSAEEKSKLSILPEKQTVNSGEIVYVSICITDEQGIVQSNEDQMLQVSVNGGRLLGFGSANPRTEESFVTGEYTSYYGRTLAVIAAGCGEKLEIKVKGDVLSEEKCFIKIKNGGKK